MGGENGFGTDYATWTFRVSDGEGLSLQASTATINLEAVNDAPATEDFTFTGEEDTTLQIPLTAFPIDDAENSPIAGVRIVTLPDRGQGNRTFRCR
jgi:hypothetical protein